MEFKPRFTNLTKLMKFFSVRKVSQSVKHFRTAEGLNFMDYLLENLGDERFQELCQALLIKEFPDVQCFPVGQPDGGRDAVIWISQNTRERGFSVYQIKYVRKPLAEDDPHKWLEGTISKEIDKIKSLIPKGAKAYYLLTNIPGTAHLDNGSIDRCNKILRDAISVPAFCWWRDDINRRLDNAYSIKWAYPEILSGPDMLRLIIEDGLSEHKERRSSTLKAFVKTQFDQDTTVRFKQVELQNRLINLFIDGPIAARFGVDEGKFHFFLHQFKNVGQHANEEDKIGGASLLLHNKIEKIFPFVVVEGAPGQGKSTLGQYICQVHRIKLLQDLESLNQLPAEHRPSSVKVPFRVDLRDLASWFNKKDPFSADESAGAPANWAKSLESFLAALVRHNSGGTEFSVTDIHAVAKLSSILLVLDGLDEVAELAKRKEVVSEIIAGVGRLKAIAASLQVVITSRPSVFGAALGFPQKTFSHLYLTNLPKSLIYKYCDKWLSARSISGREAADVRRILKVKIEQPHIRDLSRNPMQLAILLSLIHTQGSSLPDKRTALYDNYVDLFLNREAEKSEIVRENRPLLVNLHRYIAWILHCESQKESRRGSISFDRLQQLITDYLTAEDLDVTSLNSLFSGMVDRIVFLVSRVEGVYEFEVQPLREYFAARHLYETAPYSPTGAPRNGSKPDIFDTISRSSYWLNVTRFFAGCFSKGELPCLIDRLQDLSKTDGFKLTNQPRRLAAALLSDYVFSQDKRSTREAVLLILDGVSFRHPLHRRSSRRFNGSAEQISLPQDCGGDELVAKASSLLSPEIHKDYATEIIDLLKTNASPEHLKSFWASKMADAKPNKISTWLAYGLMLEALPRCSPSNLEQLLKDHTLTTPDIDVLISANHGSYILASKKRFDFAIECILSGNGYMGMSRTDILSRVSISLNPYRYLMCFHSRSPSPLRQLQSQYWGYREDPVSEPNAHEIKPYMTNCVNWLELSDDQCKKSCLDWSTSIAPWDAVVESARQVFGESLQLLKLGTVAAAIHSTAESCKEFTDLFDDTKSLCRRIRYARLRTGNHAWWRVQLETAIQNGRIGLVALVFFTWASSATIIKLQTLAESILSKLNIDEWEAVQQVVRMIHGNMRTLVARTTIDQFPPKMNERLAVIFGNRVKDESSQMIYNHYLSDYSGKDLGILEFCERKVLKLSTTDNAQWKKALPLIQSKYDLYGSSEEYYWLYPRESFDNSIPFSVASQVASDPQKYPRYLVYVAEGRCQLEVEPKQKSVADMATAEGWFHVHKRT